MYVTHIVQARHRVKYEIPWSAQVAPWSHQQRLCRDKTAPNTRIISVSTSSCANQPVTPYQLTLYNCFPCFNLKKKKYGKHLSENRKHYLSIAAFAAHLQISAPHHCRVCVFYYMICYAYRSNESKTSLYKKNIYAQTVTDLSIGNI